MYLLQQAVRENRSITNVKEIMDTWIGQMNYPVVNVEWETDGRIRLTQKRYLENPNAVDPEVFTSDFGYLFCDFLNKCCSDVA